MANTRVKASDFTGRQREAAAKEREAELRARKDEIATLQAVEAELDEKTIVDLTQGSSPIIIDAIDEVVSGDVELAGDLVVIRVAEDVEQMTFGAGNIYDFQVGKRYKVQRALAEHLLEKGLLYDRMV